MNRYEALKHAVKAHAGTVDKCGQPYVLHPIAVAEALESAEWVFSSDREDAVVVALLHDVWEDTGYGLPIEATGRLSHPLAGLTRLPGEPYADYIAHVVGAGEIAATVKLADLWHNLQTERQACLPEKEQKSLEARYLKARDRIWGALGYRWWPEGGEG